MVMPKKNKFNIKKIDSYVFCLFFYVFMNIFIFYFKNYNKNLNLNFLLTIKSYY